MDLQRPRAEALAISSGRIVYIGDAAGAQTYKGSRIETIDLKGRVVLPGFVEGHTHAAHAGMWSGRTWVNCENLRSIAEIIATLRAKAAETPPGQWVLGFRYDESQLAEKRHPNRYDLDGVSREHLVFLFHFGQHMIAINSPALQWAGITSSTPDPPGGRIDRDDRGEPTGLLRETAIVPIRDHLPAYTVEAIYSYLLEGAQVYLSAGVTSVFEAYLGKVGHLKEASAVARHVETRKLPLRYSTAIHYPLWKELQGGAGPGLNWGGNPEWVRPAAVKFFQDGSLFAEAALSDPSRTQAKSGDQYLQIPQEDFDRMVLDAHANGWPVLTHANGDLAIQSVLDAYERAMTAKKRPDPRHRIEHCQLPTDEQLDRMARLGVLPSFFPAHIWHWGDRHLVNFGAERAARLSPMASALRRGLVVGMHNDSPFTPMEPLVQVSVAVTRRSKTGDVLGPEQGISVDQALRAVTLGNAYLAHEEAIKGSLVEGKLGDVVVLEADPYRVKPEEIKDIPVAMTIVAGKVAHKKA
jgi:hypothetical protein